MKKRNITEGQFEILLWENTSRYIRGEISAKELKNMLSSYSEGTNANLRIAIIITIVLCVIGGIVIYIMTKETAILFILPVFIIPIAQVILYYVNKGK